MEIHLLDSAKQEIYRESTQQYPNKVFGFLYGKQGKYRELNLARTVSADDTAANDTYFITARHYLEAEEFAEQHKLQLLGVFISHPDHMPIPSESDIRRALPFFSYIIVSVKKGKIIALKSWQLNNGRFEEESLKIEYDHVDLEKLLEQN